MDRSFSTSSPISLPPEFSRSLRVAPVSLTYSWDSNLQSGRCLNCLLHILTELCLSSGSILSHLRTWQIYMTALSLFWFRFKAVLEKQEEWGKIKCTACLLLCPAEPGRGAAQGSRVAGVKTQKGEVAVLCCAGDVLDYHSGYCHSHFTV